MESSKALVVCAVTVLLCNQPCELLKVLGFFQQVHCQNVAMNLNSPSGCTLT